MIENIFKIFQRGSFHVLFLYKCPYGADSRFNNSQKRYFREISFFSMLFLKGGNNFFSRKRNRKVLHPHGRSKTLFQHFSPKIHKWQDEKNKFPETEKWHSRKVVKREKINFMPSTLGCELIRYLYSVREILQKTFC